MIPSAGEWQLSTLRHDFATFVVDRRVGLNEGHNGVL